MWIACVYCMCDVCYADRYGYAGMSWCRYWMHYAMCAMRDGQAGRSAGTRYAQIMLCKDCKCANMCVLCLILMKNGIKRAENGGIVDILYDGFRKCFVNCKFTFYNILSSYYKKLKTRKTRKNRSKM